MIRARSEGHSLVYDGEHIGVVHKAAGRVVCPADLRRLRLAPAALWLPLPQEVGGLQLVAKSSAAEAHSSSSTLSYHALVGHESEELSAPGLVEVLGTTSAVMRPHLSRVRFHSSPARPLSDLLSSLRLTVVGSRLCPAPGGLHLACTGIALSAALSWSIDEPKKLAKTQRREALHAARKSVHAPEEELVDFLGCSLTVERGQLRPRPSSACLVQAAATLLERRRSDSPARVLDLGCGCGSLLLALLRSVPTAHGLGLDLDAGAVQNAMRNAEALGIPRADWRVADFGQLHTVLAGSQFLVILCNPPYLATAVCEGRTTAEGGLALSAGDDGLSAYRALAQSLRLCTPSLLAPGGALLLQVPASSRARAEVVAIFRAARFGVEDEALPDHRGVARCLVVTH